MLYILIRVCLLGIFLLNPFCAPSQDSEQKHFEIEIDPLAYLLKGYSLHTAVTYSGVRTSLGIFAIKPPTFLLQNDAFSVYTSGFDFKTDYLFGDIRGFYAGLQLTCSKDRIELRDGKEGKVDLWGLNIGVRTGYRFMFGKKENQYKGFYFTPWVAIIYNPFAKTIQYETHEYSQANWVPFPTFHAGWRF